MPSVPRRVSQNRQYKTLNLRTKRRFNSSYFHNERPIPMDLSEFNENYRLIRKHEAQSRKLKRFWRVMPKDSCDVYKERYRRKKNQLKSNCNNPKRNSQKKNKNGSRNSKTKKQKDAKKSSSQKSCRDKRVRFAPSTTTKKSKTSVASASSN